MRHKIGSYIRVSTDFAAQVVEGSLDSQKHRMQGFIDAKNRDHKNWGLIQEFYIEEEGRSAGNTNRPAYQRMMRDLRAGKINFVLVADVSRLSRSVLDFCLLLKELDEIGAKYLSIKENYDTSTPQGKMMIMTLMTLAQFEREQTSERVALNFHSRASRGLRNGGPVPMGYTRDENNPATLLVHEKEASDVREIFRIFVEEGSTGKTITRLGELGIKPKLHTDKIYRATSVGIWRRQTLLYLLKNYAYVGMREVNKDNQGENQEDLKPFQRYSLVPAAWPAIVDREVFDSAQKVIEESSLAQSIRTSRNEVRVFIASSILKCPECGASYMGATSHGRNQAHRYYVHRKLEGVAIQCQIKRIRADELEADLVRHLESYLSREGYLDQIEVSVHKDYEDQLRDYKIRKVELSEQVQKFQREADAVFALLTSTTDGDSIALVKEKIAAIATAKKNAQCQLSEVENFIAAVPSPKDARQVIEKNVLDFQTLWRKSTPVQKKKLLHRLFEALILRPTGMGARYRRSELVEDSGPAEGKKKAAGSAPTAHESNLIELDSHSSRSPISPFRDQRVAGSSTDRDGRGDGI
jgi:site-specific DNA recombinase